MKYESRVVRALSGGSRLSRFLLIVGASMISPASIWATPTQEQAAQQIATLFRAARQVISDSQALINDPAKGNKGLGAAAVVEKAKANFQTVSGRPVDETDPAMKALLDSVAAVMNDAQPLINEEGKGFKGFLPAVFARQVAERTSEKLSGKVFIKLTAPRDYLRNRSNRPDEWETGVIENKFRAATWKSGAQFGEIADHRGRKGYRLALPEYYGESCLSCHGGPKGDRDITGGLKEGAKLGELGGAIVVVVYEN